MDIKKPYYIIPDDKKVETKINIDKISAAVFVNLFYDEQVEFYQKYISNIPDFIDIYIISSKNDILTKFENKGYNIIKKDNRGRDISALLVSAKEKIFQYEYICFVHDKKEKDASTKEFVDLWRKNLWDSMLQSSEYIYNLVELFERKSRLGMLTSLPPHGKIMNAWLYGSWGSNFKTVKELAKELGINVDISENKPPISYGTVFWARAKVLKRLFEKQWNYTDFPEEPMRDDGEINHAIERILQYVVEDAGFETKIVLPSSSSINFINQLNNELANLWGQLDDIFGIRNYEALEKYKERVKKIKDFHEKNKEIYLYGAGKLGEDCIKLCEQFDIVPKGILVTNIENNPRRIKDIPIISVSEFEKKNNIGIIITVQKKYQKDIVELLKRKGFEKYLIF